MSQKNLSMHYLIYICFYSAISFLLFCGCTINPATKKLEFMLVSEEKEYGIGKEVAQQVRKEMGIYKELPELRGYIKTMGDIIGRNSDRPELDYQTEIVDTHDFNAFAVPGGFVYVHRGLLERMNSADELASVMGHEIAHVAARHSASQISKSQLFNVGLLALTVATGGEAQNYGQLINMGSALMFSKYSRDDEREADYFGTQYMASAGYNPKAAIDLMEQLKKMHKEEPSDFEIWFMTHPSTSERIDNLTEEVNWFRENQTAVLNRPIKRNEFIGLLDGLAVGQWNGWELVKDGRYYNKRHALHLKVPEKWITVITHEDYTAIFVHPEQKIIVYFNVETLTPPLSTAVYFAKKENQLLEQGFTKTSKTMSDPALPQGALSAIYSGVAQNGARYLAEGIAFVKDGNGYSFFCISSANNFPRFQPTAESIAGSITFMSRQQADKVQPKRLRIHKVTRGETWVGITQKYFGSSRQMAQLAEYNGFSLSTPLPSGMLLKIPPELAEAIGGSQ